MNKILFLSIFTIVSLHLFPACAQLQLGFYGAAAVPLADFGDVYGTGYGAGFQLKRISDNKKVGFGLDLSYLRFGHEEVNFVSSGFKVTNRYRVIPLKVGLEYYFLTRKVKPFIGMDAGLYFSKYVFDAQSPFITRITNTDAWEAFGLAPGAGLAITLSERTELHFTLKYNVMFEKDRYNDTNGKFVTIGTGFNFLLN